MDGGLEVGWLVGGAGYLELLVDGQVVPDVQLENYEVMRLRRTRLCTHGWKWLCA